MQHPVVTGIGLITPFLNGVSDVTEEEIFNILNSQDNKIEFCSYKEREFKTRKLIAREDRALLSEDAKLALDVATDAMCIAEKDRSFSEEEKLEFPIYICNETAPNVFSDYENFITSYIDGKGDLNRNGIWGELGKLRQIYNPLEMLRVLSTNPLYHVSKLLGLRGGGYPIRRMSLSSLCAVEEAFIRFKRGANRALVVGVGNLTMPENISAFHRMGLIKENPASDGIVPSWGAASLVIENPMELKKEGLCELLDCRTVFKPDDDISELDWKNLFSYLEPLSLPNLTIISYNNGNRRLADIEAAAIDKYFPGNTVINYKKLIGYTGKSNNLIDMVFAILDKRISKNEYVLVNGVGSNSGLGYILFKKTVGHPLH